MGESFDVAGFSVREAVAGDTAAIHGLIDACYREYGYALDPREPEEAHVRDPHEWFRERGGAFWTAWEGRSLAGTVALDAGGGVAGELKSLYVGGSWRGRGLGRGLVGFVIERSRSLGLARLELWSDALFLDAHRLYLRAGMRAGGVRWVEASVPYAESCFWMDLTRGGGRGGVGG